MIKKSILSLIVTVCIVHCSALRRNSMKPLPPHVKHHRLPPDMWFEQKLDHFDPTNMHTWNQRYRMNDSFIIAKQNAPVFLLIEGEWEALAEWMVKGAWIDYAQKHKALCFQLEHRYYGKSQPTPDMSTQNLRYLSSEQALADLANFIKGMNKKYGLTERNKWIAFGGSYPGSLAAWLRYKYPHLVHAAISTSSPLLAKADLKVSLSTFNDDCAPSVHRAVKHFDKLVRDPSGAKTLTKQFKLCSDLNVSNGLDVSSLADTLSRNFGLVVVYNEDNRIPKSPMSEITINDLCNKMVDPGLGEPLDRYAAVNKMLLAATKSECLNFTYSQQIEELRNTVWDHSKADRQWIYQMCTEFGFFQTSTSPDELFGSNIPLSYFTKRCQDMFGPEINEQVLNDGIMRTNIMYGDVHLKATRVLFVHGSIDPWHVLGITVSNKPEIRAIYINGTAHCANMYPPSPKDPPQLTKARVNIVNQIGDWLSTD
ncbi:putative serine protease K12H4.7 isoform X2 [Cimex lectularius]|uniref:Serine carboxypeptidase S28 n=1 Tax=Cimex lectularius TaxID=79782 RepID=A0A8I6SKQ7_CIMLE|nr:putative serine protease K12H4.7 isoform X2 [Cimex lectularius]